MCSLFINTGEWEREGERAGFLSLAPKRFGHLKWTTEMPDIFEGLMGLRFFPLEVLVAGDGVVAVSEVGVDATL